MLRNYSQRCWTVARVRKTAYRRVPLLGVLKSQGSANCYDLTERWRTFFMRICDRLCDCWERCSKSALRPTAQLDLSTIRELFNWQIVQDRRRVWREDFQRRLYRRRWRINQENSTQFPGNKPTCQLSKHFRPGKNVFFFDGENSRNAISRNYPNNNLAKPYARKLCISCNVAPNINTQTTSTIT